MAPLTTAPRSSMTIIHLSDLQFGRNHRFGCLGLPPPDDQFDSLLTRLTDDLQLLRDDAEFRLVPDLVVVTGDLAEGGKKKEFSDALAFLQGVAKFLGLQPSRVLVVPGNHDINRAECEAYFKKCEAADEEPRPPYWAKWKYWVEFFEQLYQGVPAYRFTEDEPYTLFAIEELRVVVAGLNSTMRESHRDQDHYGGVGETELRWFREQLRAYREQGWFRLGLVHHNALRGAMADDANLGDAEDLTRVLGEHLNLLLHGHTHLGKVGWLSHHLPVLSTGSAAVVNHDRPAEVPNQYQVVRIEKGRLFHAGRAFAPEQKRWIGDNRVSEDGSYWWAEEKVRFEDVHGTFSGTDSRQKRNRPQSRRGRASLRTARDSLVPDSRSDSSATPSSESRSKRWRIVLEGTATDLTSIELHEILQSFRRLAGDTKLVIRALVGGSIIVVCETAFGTRLHQSFLFNSLNHVYGFPISKLLEETESDQLPIDEEMRWKLRDVLRNELWQATPHHSEPTERQSTQDRITVLEERGEISDTLVCEVRRHLQDPSYLHPVEQTWLDAALAAQIRRQRLAKWLESDFAHHIIWHVRAGDIGNLFAAVAVQAGEFDYEYGVFVAAATAFTKEGEKRHGGGFGGVHILPIGDFVEVLEFRSQEISRVIKNPDLPRTGSEWKWPVSWGPIHFNGPVLSEFHYRGRDPRLDYARLNRAIIRYRNMATSAEEPNQLQGDNMQTRLLMDGWSSWGGLSAMVNTEKMEVTFSGSFECGVAGYVIERNLPIGGKTLLLSIRGSKNAELDHDKLFKLEANDIPLKPNEDHWVNANDSAYVSSGDGNVSFKLPSQVQKLQFVFWHAQLDGLTVSGILC